MAQPLYNFQSYYPMPFKYHKILFRALTQVREILVLCQIYKQENLQNGRTNYAILLKNCISDLGIKESTFSAGLKSLLRKGLIKRSAYGFESTYKIEKGGAHICFPKSEFMKSLGSDKYRRSALRLMIYALVWTYHRWNKKPPKIKVMEAALGRCKSLIYRSYKALRAILRALKLKDPITIRLKIPRQAVANPHLFNPFRKQNTFPYLS